MLFSTIFLATFSLVAAGPVVAGPKRLPTPEVYSLPSSIWCGGERDGFEVPEKTMQGLIATSDMSSFKKSGQVCGDTPLPKDQFTIYSVTGHQNSNRFVLKFGYGRIPGGVQQVVYCDAFIGHNAETIELCAFTLPEEPKDPKDPKKPKGPKGDGK
ncbi:protein of unknown function [Taphrina deformans PYCC 5710]|uniref:Uncharacterized protein n=1 Tax=Taphrina deformans (strain PYCC 5710 / ATCC 11124 / CBS 356.35 / IMI 108563 / JCM 9778 / NBRC 8474) TaxID=1097556 RepID=R4XKG6_TAPDE|nr:protein of unknown function [Taphrina deformans PYCC 5710]|eukprot:CCG83814.1 protein of unknown function [Taphrina deformans PYCC 5710]